MKGVILLALKEMVEERFSPTLWRTVLDKEGISLPLVIPISDVEDELFFRIFRQLCKELSLSEDELMETFGRYWGSQFAPKMYSVYYRSAASAKELLLQLDRIHVGQTKTLDNARPPRFEYEWKGEKLLVMKYISERKLSKVAFGAILGVGDYYGEELRVRQIAPCHFEILFAS